MDEQVTQEVLESADEQEGGQEEGQIHYCPVCGTPLLNTPSGAVCIKGHVGIYPKVPTAISNSALMLMAGEVVLKAVRLSIQIASGYGVPGTAHTSVLYRINHPDYEGIWYRVPRSNPTEFTTSIEGNIVAMDGDKGIELRRWKDLERLLWPSITDPSKIGQDPTQPKIESTNEENSSSV